LVIERYLPDAKLIFTLSLIVIIKTCFSWFVPQRLSHHGSDGRSGIIITQKTFLAKNISDKLLSGFLGQISTQIIEDITYLSFMNDNIRFKVVKSHM
jgi:hypothetical protein